MRNLNKTTAYIAAATLVLGIMLGWIFFRNTSEATVSGEHQEHTENIIWTCSMHPQIRQAEPGQCAICGMDLVKLNTESSSEDPMEIKMSPTAMQLANVQTSVINRQKPMKELRLNGKIKADERRIYSQASHIPGRIEKLTLNFTGEAVSKGQVLAYIYSPELVNAQEELFEAYKIRENQPGLYQAVRGKLLNWKLTDKQIDKIISTGKTQTQFPVMADVSGIVLNKKVNLGDYIKKGESLFDVVDLSSIWVLFDVYESDITWIKKGDKVSFTVSSFPSENFVGSISFIDPLINPRTRVATARVEIANKNGKLKPDMFVQGLIKSPLKNNASALVVPKSAVMWTGERSVVYVKKVSAEGVVFTMRIVTLGASLGDAYIITKGLEDGEEIATNGTFSIDAAAQLDGKPSMMNPEGGAVMTGHNHGGTSNACNTTTTAHSQAIAISKKAKDALTPLFDEYLKMKNALVADDFKQSKQITSSFQSKLSKTNMAVFTGEAHDVWMQHSSAMGKALKLMNKAENIGDVRKHFKTLSDQIIMLAITFGPFDQDIFVQHCPMADDNKGADWISGEKTIKNPYFGKSMLGCGEVTKEIK